MHAHGQVDCLETEKAACQQAFGAMQQRLGRMVDEEAALHEAVAKLEGGAALEREQLVSSVREGPVAPPAPLRSASPSASLIP
jgi:hypothetical protein